jgi:hypothetical protein
MLTLAKTIVEYPRFKRQLLTQTAFLALGVSLILLLKWPHALMPYVMGVIISYGYLLSLAVASEMPQRKLAIGLSIFRVAIVSFLIVWVGQFQVFATGVVLAGFLSYKIILTLLMVRHTVALKK